MNSHHDTVEPNSGYTIDPFKPLVKDEKLYGLGSNDAGGALVSLISTFTYFYNVENLKYNIIIAATAEEESSGPLGLNSLLVDLPKLDIAIVGEPTLLKLVDGHKASIGLDTEVTGYEVHSSLLPSGVSAIMTASKLVNWITNKTEENQNKTPRDLDKLFHPPFTTLHVGKINGGTASNITAKKCSFTTDIRCLPLDDGEKIIEEYEKYAEMIDTQNKEIRPESVSYTHLTLPTSDLV